jgi:hypothetical protein
MVESWRAGRDETGNFYLIVPLWNPAGHAEPELWRQWRSGFWERASLPVTSACRRTIRALHQGYLRLGVRARHCGKIGGCLDGRYPDRRLVTVDQRGSARKKRRPLGIAAAQLDL